MGGVPTIVVKNRRSLTWAGSCSSFEVVTTALAVRFPFRFRHVRHQELSQQIRDAADLHYILLSGYSPEHATRVPTAGWFRGK